jgi:hypothetical protein
MTCLRFFFSTIKRSFQSGRMCEEEFIMNSSRECEKKSLTLKLGLVVFDPIIVLFLTMCFVYKSQNNKKYNALEKLFIIIYKICEQKS